MTRPVAESMVDQARKHAYDIAVQHAINAVLTLPQYHEYSWGIDESGDGEYIKLEDIMNTLTAMVGAR